MSEFFPGFIAKAFCLNDLKAKPTCRPAEDFNYPDTDGYDRLVYRVVHGFD